MKFKVTIKNGIHTLFTGELVPAPMNPAHPEVSLPWWTNETRKRALEIEMAFNAHGAYRMHVEEIEDTPTDVIVIPYKE